jgi:GST-like protein
MMIRFYFFPSTNPYKVALYLEESGLPYEMVPIDIRRGAQFSPEFLALNPNAKTPALTDGDLALFDSTAILLHLTEKTGKFLPPAALRGELLSWLLFIASGIGPYSGQAVYFRHFGAEASEDAKKRYAFEAGRHWRIVEDRLQRQPFMVGDAYSVVDMSLWGWARALPRVLGDEAWARYPAIHRLVEWVNDRPAAARALALAEQHAFKMELDAPALAHMFRYRPPVAADAGA